MYGYVKVAAAVPLLQVGDCFYNIRQMEHLLRLAAAQNVQTVCPAVVTVTKPAFEPRIASIKDRIKAKQSPIVKLTLNEIKLDPSRLGLKGSPTKVKKTFTPSTQKHCVKIEEQTATASAAKLIKLLSEAAVL